MPTSYWPAPIPFLAEILPLSHGLRAVRDLLANAPASTVLTGAVLELCVAIGWLTVACWTLSRFMDGSRRDGSIEFSE